MTIRHLSPDEFATYLIGDAMRRKLAAGVDGYGPLGHELQLLRRWIAKGLTVSELAHVVATVPAVQIGDLEFEAVKEPSRPR